MATNFNTVVTSSATISQINTEGDASLITKQYADDAYGGGGGSGTVTSVSTGLGLTGGDITTTGTIDLDLNSLTTRSSALTGTGILSAFFPMYNSLLSPSTQKYSLYNIGLALAGSGLKMSTGYQLEIDLSELSTVSSIASSTFDNVFLTYYQGSLNVHRRLTITNFLESIAGSGLQVNTSDNTLETTGGGGGSSTADVSTNSTTLDLSNALGTYYMNSANTSTGPYTIASNPAPVVGGFAYVKISVGASATNFPSVTGATTVRTGAPFQANEEYIMVVTATGKENEANDYIVEVMFLDI